jgi:multidrug resistance efflux pump
VSRKLGLIVLVCVAVAVGGFLYWRRTHAPKPAPTPVAVATPQQPAEIILSGLVEPRTVVTVGPPVEGILDAYFVDIGQEIYQGQLLGRIRNPRVDDGQQRAQAALDAAQSRVTAIAGDQLAARLETSRAAADQTRAHNEIERQQKNYDRQQGLWNAGATARLVWEKAQKDYTDAKADAEKQDAAMQTAQQREAALDRGLEAANQAVTAAKPGVEQAKSAGGAAEMHSPVDGVVVARQDLVGQMVDPSMKELVKIGTDPKTLTITLQNDNAASRVVQGQPAKVVVGGEEFAGVIRPIDMHSFAVDFTVPEGGKQLGQPAQVIIKF